MTMVNFQVLDDLMKKAIDDGECAGASAMVVKNGNELYYGNAGMADIETGKPIARDTIFRIYSQSKSITGFATVMNIEKGLISPRIPVYEFLPGFQKQVYCSPDGNGVRAVGDRCVYVADLMNMTSGVSYPGNWNDSDRAVTKVIDNLVKERESGTMTGTVELANRLGRCPLAFQPGDHWAYGYSADIMGAVIETATGMKFSQFLKKNIFEPLGMNDTGFTLAESKRSRLAKAYEFGTKAPVEASYANWHLGLNGYREDTAFESGGAGLVSTIDDFAQFVRMLQGGGTLDGNRVLSPAGFRYLTSPQLTPEQARTFNWQDLSGNNYANFMFVKQPYSPLSTFDNPGSFGWGGWLGTNFFVDPVEKLSLLFMTQNIPGNTRTALYYRMRNAVYAAF